MSEVQSPRLLPQVEAVGFCVQIRGQVGVCMQKDKCQSLISYSPQVTESTEDIPSDGYHYLQRQTVDHTTREGNALILLVLDTGLLNGPIQGSLLRREAAAHRARSTQGDLLF